MRCCAPRIERASSSRAAGSSLGTTRARTSAASMRRRGARRAGPQWTELRPHRRRVEQPEHRVRVAAAGPEHPELGGDLHRLTNDGRPQLGRVQQRHDEVVRRGQEPGRAGRVGGGRVPVDGTEVVDVQHGDEGRGDATGPLRRHDGQVLAELHAASVHKGLTGGQRVGIEAGRVERAYRVGRHHGDQRRTVAVALSGRAREGRHQPGRDLRQLVALRIGGGTAGLAEIADVADPGQGDVLDRGQPAQEHRARLGHGAAERERGGRQRDGGRQRHLPGERAAVAQHQLLERPAGGDAVRQHDAEHTARGEQPQRADQAGQTRDRSGTGCPARAGPWRWPRARPGRRTCRLRRAGW